MLPCFSASVAETIALWIMPTEQVSTWLTTQPTYFSTWLQAQNKREKPEGIVLFPDASGRLAAAALFVSTPISLFSYADLPLRLPPGVYALAGVCSDVEKAEVVLAWGLGSYRYTRYKASQKPQPQLLLPVPAIPELVVIQAQLDAIYWGRDLINTPAEDLGPAELATAAQELATQHNAHYDTIVGDDLLKQNYPAIHCVGRASTRAPQLIHLAWGKPEWPLLTLVGKGVCFDSGGLNLKPGSAMALMKKDMGGAAHALALAKLIMTLQWPIQLKVWIPAVDNVISGNAYRPGDVLVLRSGKTVEVTDTDAEGRLILADALHRAGDDQPRMLVDFSTLTGAARVAVGTEIAAYFTNDETLAASLQEWSVKTQDPCWRLPLYTPYRRLYESSVADMMNATATSYAGAITAALFLQESVNHKTSWVHFDLMAWNISSTPGRPQGGEIMGLRAISHFLQDYFGGVQC